MGVRVFGYTGVHVDETYRSYTRTPIHPNTLIPTPWYENCATAIVLHLTNNCYGYNNSTINDCEVRLTIHQWWFNEKVCRNTLFIFPLFCHPYSIPPRHLHAQHTHSIVADAL